MMPRVTAALDHTLLPYGSDDDFVARVADFLHGARVEGQRDVVITTSGRLGRLERAGALPPGAITLDSSSWYGAPVHCLSQVLDLLATMRDAPLVRMVGDVAIDDPDLRAEWARVEAAVNHVLRDRLLELACAYGPDVPAPLREDAHLTHPALCGTGIPTGAYLEPADLLERLDGDLEAPDTTPAVDVVLPADLGALRASVRDDAERAGHDPIRVQEFVVALTELAANALRHGGGIGRARVWIDEASLVCEVTDEGAEPVDPLAGWAPPDPSTPGGAGLWITRHMVDRLELSPLAPKGLRALAVRRR